jgi:hypothetical protein
MARDGNKPGLRQKYDTDSDQFRHLMWRLLLLCFEGIPQLIVLKVVHAFSTREQAGDANKSLQLKTKQLEQERLTGQYILTDKYSNEAQRAR